MTTFDKREEGFEQKFAHDEELRFKAMRAATSFSGCGPPKSSGFPAPKPKTMPPW